MRVSAVTSDQPPKSDSTRHRFQNTLRQLMSHLFSMQLYPTLFTLAVSSAAVELGLTAYLVAGWRGGPLYLFSVSFRLEYP